MSHHVISLADRTDLSVETVLLNGTQALVRLMLMQSARDRKAGLKTAGLVTGYRGSPLGAVDFQMQRAKNVLDSAKIEFQPTLNEDLAATALWGSQQAELRGEGKFDGVFGLWYGKGPGVDRTGDVFRHVNFAGTSPHGGVLAALGDDHTGESSTTLHQSEFTMMDSYMPVLSPAGVQEILDLGLAGYALSRFAGVWAGLKCIKDTIEATSVVNGDPFRLQFVHPEFDMPDGGLNIRLIDTPQDQEYRMVHHKRQAISAFAHANKLDRRMAGRPGARIGFVAAGKNWLDLTHALSLLDIDDTRAEVLGLTTYKIAMTWPLEPKGFQEWAEDLDLIVVVEEKRKIIESQIKEILFNRRGDTRVIGGTDLDGQLLFRDDADLDPVTVATKLGQILTAEGRGSDQLSAAIKRLHDSTPAISNAVETRRTPYFCSGCPHNTSTKLPEGSRAYAGIGCHYMVQWMDRETVGFTQMGGEGANWIGEAPFSNRDHVFQNLGDGTYNHSGIQAIRAALATDTTITYKILFNDAVAMTGGQSNDGDLSAYRVCEEIAGMGVKNIAFVYDDKEDFDLDHLPKGTLVDTRENLPMVQEKFQKNKGVSVIVYAQTCAAEKRRRRKRGKFPDPDQRVFINPDVCEGCGDCGVQSNCVSILPFETPLGRKRQIDQSSCNKDFSCIKGFCPSFVTVHGGVPRKNTAMNLEIPDLPDPRLPAIEGTHNVLLTGVGGTGVVTIGAILSMAAHLDGKGAAMLEMAGMAQKGGAVLIHCRFANTPDDISAIRVADGECNTLIGGDLVVSCHAETKRLYRSGQTKAVVNSFEMITGAFTKDRLFQIPGQDLMSGLQDQLKGDVQFLNATKLAENTLGDSVYANMILVGAAFQAGQLPLSETGILDAISLNGAKVSENQRAFQLGRYFQSSPQGVDAVMASAAPDMPTTEQAITAQLKAYGSGRLKRFSKKMAAFEGHPLRDVIARNYAKILCYKDEYEVARMLGNTRKMVEDQFEGTQKIEFHLAPPLMSRMGPDGRPKKKRYGRMFERLAPVLAKMRFLRATPFDVFGYTKERRAERALIPIFEKDMQHILDQYSPEQHVLWAELANIPDGIRGFGPVKEQAIQEADEKRKLLLGDIEVARSQVLAAQ